MQPQLARLTCALRALANSGPHQLSTAELASSSWRACLAHHDGLAQASRDGSRHLMGSLGARTMSSAPTSNDQQKDPPASQPDAPPSRPTLGSRLRDLLAVSSWRISQGQVGRLADVKEDLQAATSTPPAASTTTAPTSPATETAAPASAADAAAAPHPASEQHLQAQLLQGLQHEQAQTPAGPDESLSSSSAGGDKEASAQPQQQEPSPTPPQQRLLHAKFGYAALGGVVPAEEVGGSSAAGLASMLAAQHPRVNPRRRFMPGETYEPQDLNPFAARATGRTRANDGAVRRPGAAEVLEKADYKNVAFLSRWFLTPGGRLLSRRQTRLPVHVHKYVSRQIKLARHMGLMAGEARLDKLHLSRLREQELLEAQRRAAAAAASIGGGGVPRAVVVLGSGGDGAGSVAGTAGAVVSVAGGGGGGVRRGAGGPRVSELADLGA